jgi:hypothetical protein
VFSISFLHKQTEDKNLELQLGTEHSGYFTVLHIFPAQAEDENGSKTITSGLQMC